LGTAAAPGRKSTNGTPPAEERSEPIPPRRYDIIFLDNSMPVISGVQVIKALRAARSGDFVVGVTGNALREDQDEYILNGVDHVLTKPVFESQLRNMVVEARERRRASTPEQS